MAVAEKPMAKRRPPNRDPVHIKLDRLIKAKCPGRSMASIAEAAGMSRQQFHQLLAGDIAYPRLDTLQAILDAIGATLADYERA